jgi:hypothetical protein
MRTKTIAALVGAVAALSIAGSALAQQGGALTLTVKDQKFQPRELRAPANTPLTLTIKNLDAKSMEFESVSLRVEKVVVGNGTGTLRIRPLAPGRYNFFDDFNQSNTGVLVVE